MADGEGSDNSFEREKWQADLLIRTREVAVKEHEQDVRQQEVEAKLEELKRSRWANPLVLALLAAAIGATGSAVVAYINGVAQRDQDAMHSKAENTLQANKATAERILQMIKTGNADKAAENLKFLVDAGLVENQTLNSGIRTFLASRSPGQGPSLPAESAPVPGPAIRNPYGWIYPTQIVSLLKITSVDDLSYTQVATLPITNDGIVYHEGDHITVFLIYRVGDGTDFANAGTKYVFNPSPLYEVAATPIFSNKNWGGFPMFVDGHLQYFSYDGYYWVIEDKPAGTTTPNDAKSQWTDQEAIKSKGIFPSNPDQIVGKIIDHVEKNNPHRRNEEVSTVEPTTHLQLALLGKKVLDVFVDEGVTWVLIATDRVTGLSQK